MTVRDGSLAVGSQLLLDLLKPAALMFSFFSVASRQQLTSIETPDICNYAHSSRIYIYLYIHCIYVHSTCICTYIHVGQKHRAHWQGWTMLILFGLFWFSRRVKVSSALNLWSDVSNEWWRANVEWLRGPPRVKCSFETHWWKGSFGNTHSRLSAMWNKSSQGVAKVDYFIVLHFNSLIFLNHFTCST